MSIETIAVVNWNGTIDSTNKIGISDTLDNLSVDVWSDASVFVTACHNKWCKFRRFTTSYPVTNSETNECPWYLKVNTGYTNINNNNNEDIYYRSVLLAVPIDYNYSNWNAGTGGRLRSDASTIRIITSLSVIKNNIDVILNKNSNVVTSAVYTVNENIPETTATGTFTYDGVNYRIICADIFTDGTDFFVNVPTSPPFNVYDSPGSRGVMGAWCYDVNGNKMMSLSPQIFEEDEKTFSIGSSGGYYNLGPWNNHELPSEVDEVFYATFDRIGTTWHLDSRSNEYYHLMNVSRFGLKFKYNNENYKPIISQGVVTGYTTDMAVPSDIDNWTDISGHNIPITPPSPTGDVTDKEHKMPLAYIGGNAGMVTFYEINKTGLASADDISDAISRFDIAQIGKDLLRNFISFKAFAAIRVDDTVDRQIKIAGIGLEDSGGHELTGRVIGGVKPIDLFPVSKGVTIPTLYNDYRDYEPYTRIQMYVPFCGWFSLPSWCIGKKITGTMFTDLYNGTVKAVIYASDTVVAEVGGCCAYDIPFVADATGAKASAVISSALTTAAAVGATVAMPNVATGIAAVSAAANLAATLNGNDTTLKGVLGDGSNLNGLLHVYIKVSRPMSPNGSTTIPDSYKHEIGIPTMKEIKISVGDGYIQVMDAKVTGTMTAREKQMIVDGFRHGLNF